MVNDYGFDPLGDGKYKMVPSGDIVDKDERDRRLPLPKITNNRRRTLIGAYNAMQVEMMQGGKLKS